MLIHTRRCVCRGVHSGSRASHVQHAPFRDTHQTYCVASPATYCFYAEHPRCSAKMRFSVASQHSLNNGLCIGIASNPLPCYVFLLHRQQSAALFWFLLASPAIPCHAMLFCVRAQLARSLSAVARISMGIASILHRCSPYACFHGAVPAR